MAVAERLWSGQHGLTRPPTTPVPKDESAAAGASEAGNLAPKTRRKLGGLPPRPRLCFRSRSITIHLSVCATNQA